jgi:ABC-type multidrug transport system fused ATPase/permease subunit
VNACNKELSKLNQNRIITGVAFAAQGISQFGNFSEAFTAARVAAYDALKTINRRQGASSETIYRKPGDDDLGTTTHSKRSKKSKEGETDDELVVRAILPTYEIDSTSDAGVRLKDVTGKITFNDVSFSYPTRPREIVLDHFTTEIPPGKTVAFVGPSGSGKSTVVGMVERFYDPQSGRVELDGVNLRDLNVSSLRKLIGYVGQVRIV